MRILKKKHFLFVAFCVMASFASVNAECDERCCEPCGPCRNICDGFCLDVDFLYWHPCFDDLDYAVTFSPAFTSTGVINAKYQRLCHDYDPGVRISLMKDCFFCDLDLEIAYTYYHSDETDRVTVDTANEVNLTFVHPALADETNGDVTASGHHKLDYQTIEALFGRTFCWCDDHYFMPFFGIHGLKLDRNLTATSTNSGNTETTTYNWTANVKALGIKIGSEYSHTLCDCFGMFARASAILLAGDLEAESQSHDSSVTPDVVNFDHADCCIFIPGYNLQAGFTLCTCCCNQEMTWRLGYELIEWRNVPTPKRFFTDSSGNEGSSTRGAGSTLGLHGLFAGMEFCF